MHPSVHARTSPDKPAIIMAGSGETITFSQLEAHSNQGAHLLRRHGVRPGDAVAIFMDNHPRFLEVVWSAERIGAYYTMIPAKLTCNEALYILQDCGAQTLIASASIAHAATIGARAPGLGLFSIGGEIEGYRNFVREAVLLPRTPVADERPGADMMYTGGTTGNPRGVRPPLPAESSLDRPTRISALGESLYGMNADTVYLHPAPLYHGAPLRWSMAVQRMGGTVIVMERFDPESALAAIERYRVTHSQWVPTHFHRLLKLPEQVKARYDLGSMRVAMHAAAPCPVPLKEKMMEWWGPILHEYYSATESSGFCSIGPQDWLTHKGSVGQAQIGDVRICDERGDPVPSREHGTVYFEGAPQFEYYKDPAKTAASRSKHGWATLGDIGWVDEEGFLYLVDRKEFTVISGGVNVYPQEIENVLVSHPDVADAAVFGIPDEDLGECVVAVVQPYDWSRSGGTLAQELMTYLRASLSAVKLPKHIEFRPELPRQATGKLSKRLIRDEFRASCSLATRTAD